MARSTLPAGRADRRHAHAHGARLYTRNAADLRGLEDLVEIVAL